MDWFPPWPGFRLAPRALRVHVIMWQALLPPEEHMAGEDGPGVTSLPFVLEADMGENPRGLSALTVSPQVS